MKLRYQKCMSSRVFKEPLRDINDNYIKIDSYIKNLEKIIRKIKEEKNKKYIELISKLDTLSPLKTLTRGYTIIEKDNKLVKNAKNLKTGDKINIKFVDSKKEAQIL